jgi:hypothetical protein
VFWASGAFHEWLVTFIFDPNARQPLVGSTAFMLWNALLIVVEYHVRDSKYMSRKMSTIPWPLKPGLVILLGLPVAHWLTDPYVRSDFFDHAALSLPIVKRHATVLVD